jgi:hypothetical protein
MKLSLSGRNDVDVVAPVAVAPTGEFDPRALLGSALGGRDDGRSPMGGGGPFGSQHPSRDRHRQHTPVAG